MNLPEILNPAPTERAQRDLLNAAIQSSTLERLRVTLQSICENNSEAFELASHQLLTGQDTRANQEEVVEISGDSLDEDEDDEDDEDDEEEEEEEVQTRPTPVPAPQGQKRKLNYTRQRYKICSQCHQEYDVEANEKGKPLCRWHEGELEVDWDGDFWADHDERCHGTIDSEWARGEYPEGFIWSCCEQDGNARGCQVTKHKPDEVKRARMMESSKTSLGNMVRV